MYLQNRLKMTLSFLLIANMALFSQSVTADSKVIEHWENFEDLDIKQPDKGLTSIVFFRPVEHTKGPSVNVYIDGEYHASILPGAYTQLSLCPGTHHFSVAYTNVLTKYKAKKRVDHKNNFKKHQIVYYELTQGKNRPLIRQMEEKKALSLIKKLPPRQKHTISRVSKRRCEQGKMRQND